MKVSFSIASAANDEAKDCLVNSTKYVAEERLPIGRSFLRKKIVIPPLSEHYIHRARLDPFVRKISLSRLSVLLAPAGYGKTSLLNYWLKNEKVLFPHVAWLTIDSRDNDIFRLCYYLIESLSCVLDSETKAGLYSLIDNSSCHWSESTSERLVIALVEKLELIDEPISIILDNFQFIQSDQINNFFNSLLNHSPRNVSLIVLTCQTTKLSTTKLRLDRVLTEIGVTDLQFTEPEANELLDKILPSFVEPEVKAKLILRCEGWGAGLHLLSIALQCKDLQTDVVLPDSIDYLNEYFSNEVFDVLSEVEQKQLYRLGSIDYWCSDLCQHLLGDNIAEEWLQGIVFKLGFIEQLNDRSPWYRPHPMLRQALIDLGKIGTESQSSIYTEASVWFDAQGMVSDAIEYAIKSGNTDSVLSLILKLSDVSLLDQSMATLLELRDKILEQGREKAGRLPIVYSWILLACSRIDEAEGYIRELISIPEYQSDFMTPEICAINAFIAKARGDVVLAEQLARDAILGLAEDRVGIRVICHLIISNSLGLMGRFDDARTANRAAVLLSRKTTNVKLEMLAVYDSARIEFARGYLNRVSSLVKQGLELSGSSLCDLHNMAESRLRVYWALVKMHQGKLAEADRLVNSAISEAERSGDIGAFMAYLIKAILLKGSGELDQAFVVIGRAERFITVWKIDDVSYRTALVASKAMLWIEQGNNERATTALAELESMKQRGIVADVFPMLPGVFDLLDVRLLIKTGDTVRALERLTEMQRVENKRAPNSVMSIYILIYQSVLYNKGRKPDRALMAMRTALQKAEVESWLSPFWDLSDDIRLLISQILSVSGSADGDARFLDRVAKLCDVGRLSAGSLTDTALKEPISDREMGVLELIAQGLSNQDIADKLFISLHTVKTHARRINNKLGVKSRTQAVVKARQHGLL